MASSKFSGRLEACGEQPTPERAGSSLETPGKAEGIIDVFATVRLELESRPECITLVRSMLGGLADFLELDAELLDDLKTAISEACNNVVLHAYGSDTGPLALSLQITRDSFDVVVRDRGSGLQRISSADNRMGVGLAVITALASRAEFTSAPGEGTEVRMSFAADGLAQPGPAPGSVDTETKPVQLAGDIVASLSPPELLPDVMGRLVRAVAAGAHFAVDRFPSLGQLTDEIGRQAGGAGPGAHVGFSITGRPRRLELRVGPLPPGSGTGLFTGEVPDGLEPLVESLDTQRFGDGELLYAVVVEPRT